MRETLAHVIERDRKEIEWQALRLPLPGLTEWFLATYLDELHEDESTMDKLGPALAALYY